VVVASLAERNGYHMAFGQFLRHGIVIVLVSLSIASLWLWVRYL
jgi:Na+/H+ antiporter NhaD/arsenite permease-like protein